MRILLDTHIALWAVLDDPKLPGSARDLLLDAGNAIFFSAASVWEIAIKHSLKPDRMPISGAEAQHWFRAAGYTELGISADHAAGVANLPAIHTDPFDRLLVSQSIAEPLRLLTHDAALKDYASTVIFC